MADGSAILVSLCLIPHDDGDEVVWSVFTISVEDKSRVSPGFR